MRPAYWSTISASPGELAGGLMDVLGLRLATAAIGVADTRTVRQWSEGSRQINAPKTLQRMRFVAHLVHLLSADATNAETRAWFEFFIPDLGNRTPLQILDDNTLEDAAPMLLDVVASSSTSSAAPQQAESSEAR